MSTKNNSDKFHYDLIVGDHINGDGHDRHEAVSINSSHDMESLKAAYELGVPVLGFSIKDVCRDSSSLTADLIEQLEVFGMDTSSLNPGFSLNSDEYAEIWVLTAKLGNPDLEIEFGARTASFHIGGYGLFD